MSAALDGTRLAGVRVFTSMAAARQEGFEPEARFCEARGTGWVVRKRMAERWARALVWDGAR